MKEKIKKILRGLSTIITVLWIFDETASYYTDINTIVGILILWGIIMYSLKEKKVEELIEK